MKRKINIAALRDVEKHISAEAERFDMEYFARDDKDDRTPQPPCNTVACVAGWGIIREAQRQGLLGRIRNIGSARLVELAESLTEKLGMRRSATKRVKAARIEHCYKNRLFENVAAKVFGITRKEAEALFFMDSWPQEFSQEYFRAALQGSATKRVNVAVARIEHFIATGE